MSGASNTEEGSLSGRSELSLGGAIDNQTFEAGSTRRRRYHSPGYSPVQNIANDGISCSRSPTRGTPEDRDLRASDSTRWSSEKDAADGHHWREQGDVQYFDRNQQRNSNRSVRDGDIEGLRHLEMKHRRHRDSVQECSHNWGRTDTESDQDSDGEGQSKEVRCTRRDQHERTTARQRSTNSYKREDASKIQDRSEREPIDRDRDEQSQSGSSGDDSWKSRIGRRGGRTRGRSRHETEIGRKKSYRQGRNKSGDDDAAICRTDDNERSIDNTSDYTHSDTRDSPIRAREWQEPAKRRSDPFPDTESCDEDSGNEDGAQRRKQSRLRSTDGPRETRRSIHADARHNQRSPRDLASSSKSLNTTTANHQHGHAQGAQGEGLQSAPSGKTSEVTMGKPIRGARSGEAIGVRSRVFDTTTIPTMISDLKSFVCSPLRSGPGSVVRCFIERNRSGTRKFSHVFSMYADLEDGSGRLLLASRKVGIP